MREYLFRGKCIEPENWIGRKEVARGDWVEGSLLSHTEVPRIKGDACMIGCYVHPATVGQYTGMKDKNGEPIFEGDVVRYEWDDDDTGGIGVTECSVIWHRTGWYLDCGGDYPIPLFRDGDKEGYVSDCEVIGTIHDALDII